MNEVICEAEQEMCAVEASVVDNLWLIFCGKRAKTNIIKIQRNQKKSSSMSSRTIDMKTLYIEFFLIFNIIFA